MNDQSGLYSDLSGQGSVWAARKAIEDFRKATGSDAKIEVVFADHQNKPDIGANVVRRWYDVDKVDVVVDVPTSSVALAVVTVLLFRCGIVGELQALLSRLFARRDAEAGRMAAKSAE